MCKYPQETLFRKINKFDFKTAQRIGKCDTLLYRGTTKRINE